MTVFINSNGDVIGKTDESIHQGSVAANEIILVCPFSAAVVAVSFTLPNGIVLPPKLVDSVFPEEYRMTKLDFEYSVSDEMTLYAYKYTFKGGNLTAKAGNLQIQFLITVSTTPKAEPGTTVAPTTQTITTNLVNLPIYNGSRFLPEPPLLNDDNLYNTIVDYLGDILNGLDAIPDIETAVSQAQSDIGTLKDNVSTANKKITSLENNKVDVTGGYAEDLTIQPTESTPELSKWFTLQFREDKGQPQRFANFFLSKNDSGEHILTIRYVTVDDETKTIENVVSFNLDTKTVDGNKLNFNVAKIIGEITAGSANITNKLTAGEVEVTGNLTVSGNSTVSGNETVDGDLTVKGKLNVNNVSANDVQASKVSAMGDITSEGSVKAEEMESYGNLTVGGNLIVRGDTTTVKQETLTVKDNIIVTNSEGADFSVSGIVINTGETYNEDDGYDAKYNGKPKYYGIVYIPNGDVVSVGIGTVVNGEFSFIDRVVNVNGEDVIVSEAVPLAARKGDFHTNEIPVWDPTYNAFVPSTAKAQQIVDNKANIDALSNELQELRMSQKGTPGLVYVLHPSDPPQYHLAGINWQITDPTELEELIIADYINNIPVTKILTGAFELEYFYNLKKVVIPGTVQEIEPHAFMFNSSYEGDVEIILNNGLRKIGESAFSGFNNSLIHANIPSTVGYIGLNAFPINAHFNLKQFLAFEYPYNWVGAKLKCANELNDIEPSKLTERTPVGVGNVLSDYDYIYNRVWEEDPQIE